MAEYALLGVSMMMSRAKFTLLVCSAFLLLAPRATVAQTCDQTLSVGANVASAVSSAPNGSTICLNGGNYGTVNFFNIARSGFVTVRSTSGVSAQISPQVGNSRYIRFTNLTVTDMLLNSCSVNVELWNSNFVPNADGLVYNYDTACSGVTDMGLVVDGVIFDRVMQAAFEGRLSIRGVRGLKIRNSVFSGQPGANQSDGIQIVGGSTNVEIGPGNRFSGILQSLCGSVHCDAIQDFGGGPNNTIRGNVFESGDTFIMMPDGSRNYIVENNVFNGAGSSYIDKIQFGSAVSPIFRHNTLKGVRASFDSKTGSAATQNALVENNILLSGSSWKTQNGSGCSGCTFRYTLFDGTASVSGTNNLTGTPSFVGGSSPSGWAGWQLTASSIGKYAGSDGKDLGVDYGTGSSSAVPTAPMNLRISS